MRTRSALLTLAPAVLGGLASAQSITVLLRVGDAVPGAGNITDIEAVDVDSEGNWTAVVRTDDPVAHTVVYAWGAPFIRTGEAPQWPPGVTVAALDLPTWDFFGIPTYVAGLSGGMARQALMFGKGPELSAGEPATTYTVQLPAGSTWRRFESPQYSWSTGGYLMRGAIDDPLGGQTDLSFAAVTWHAGSVGAIWGIEVLALEGRPAPGLSRRIQEVRAGPDRARLSRDGGKAVWSCDLEGPSRDDGCVYLSHTFPPYQPVLLAREGAPSPVAGRSWGALEDHAVDLNSADDWTLRGRLDASDPATDEVLVRSGVLLAREGFPLPATAPHPLESLGQGRGALDGNGRVLWYARWSDPATPGQDEALLHEGIAVVRTGTTTVAGSPLVDVESGPRSYSLDPQSGRFVVFRGSLADGTRGLFLLDQGGMQTYCTAKTSSQGCTPLIGWSGQPPSASAGSGFLLTASNLLQQTTLLFCYGTSGPAALPFHGGTLCVLPPLRRGPPLTSAGSKACWGGANFDFNAWIASGIDPSLGPGVEVHAQAWFRDPGFAPPDDVGLTPGLRFVIGP